MRLVVAARWVAGERCWSYLWGSVKSQGALGVASSERGRGAARDLSALSI